MASLVSFAQIKDGYYRVHNYKTGRYIYVLDNTGSINISTSSADMGALKLWKDKSKALTDPATIIYAEYKYKGSYGEMYDLRAQGTGVYGIIGYYVNIAPYYVGFAISFPSTNMKAKYISKIVGAYAVMSDITTDIVPESTPILIECTSNVVTDNKLNVLKSNASFSGTNLLKGVYFNYDERPKSKDARKAYDPQTMRVLGLTSEGKLGYITSDIDYLPANQSYLVVPSGTAPELTIVTEAEYIAGIANIKIGNNDDAPVYDLNGKKVSESKASIHSLPQGIYISNGKKIRIK